jgi:hypothetical protein
MTISPRQLEILQHALGADKYGRGKDVGHGEFNRNHFCAGGEDEEVCRGLVALGLMREHRRTGIFPDYNCSVSEAGILAMRENSPKPPKLTRSQQRYRRFLDADSDMSFREWLEYEKGGGA